MLHSRLASPSATADVLAAHGIRLKKSLGQHFLIDDNVVGRILDLAAVPENAPVLEVGPGIGTLTVALLSVAGAVVAVERDATLLSVLQETTADLGSLAVVHADAVTVDPALLVTPSGPPVALVANLPYGVAATVVLRLFEELPALESATVMVQSEVADRMSAEPGCKDYGAYTVKLRLLAEPGGRFTVAPGCFMPPPRVSSTVLRLDRKPVTEPPEVLADAARLAGCAFAQRRKTLRNSLSSALPAPMREVDDLLSAAGIDGGRRAETLSVGEYLEMALQARLRGTLP